MKGIQGRSGFRKTLASGILLHIVSLTNAQVKNAEFKKHSRTKSTYFTRKRKMTFGDLILYMLNSYNCSTQCGLRRFFATVRNQFPMRQQSFSKAR